MRNNVFEMIKRGEDFKIRVTKEQSEKVQEAVLKAGGSWSFSGNKILFTNKPFLYFSSKRLSYGGITKDFINKVLPEAFFIEEITHNSKRSDLWAEIKRLREELNESEAVCNKNTEALLMATEHIERLQVEKQGVQSKLDIANKTVHDQIKELEEKDKQYRALECLYGNVIDNHLETKKHLERAIVKLVLKGLEHE